MDSEIDRTLSGYKKRISYKFSKAAIGYDQAATLQWRTAQNTLQKTVNAIGSQHLNTILDLGSGTCKVTTKLASWYPQTTVVGIDSALGMLDYGKKVILKSSAVLCGGDIEALPFKKNSFDLVFSNLSLQWCQFKQLFSEVFAVLNVNGWFIFSTLAQGSLEELNSSWMAIGEQGRVNKQRSLAFFCELINKSNFIPLEVKEEKETIFYANLSTLLRSLKAQGVNTVFTKTNGLMTIKKFKNLEEAYESHRTVKGLPLTYKITYAVLRMPSRKEV